MSTLELRQEMSEMIKNEDDSSLKTLYKQQRQLNKMIAEGEDDIKAGRLHSQSEVQKMIENWVQ
ncbi:MAG: hypothetical protein ACWIPI_08525 [Polaribacter sp.]